jgi:hypothetical protein
LQKTLELKELDLKETEQKTILFLVTVKGARLTRREQKNYLCKS